MDGSGDEVWANKELGTDAHGTPLVAEGENASAVADKTEPASGVSGLLKVLEIVDDGETAASGAGDGHGSSGVEDSGGGGGEAEVVGVDFCSGVDCRLQRTFATLGAAILSCGPVLPVLFCHVSPPRFMCFPFSLTFLLRRIVRFFVQASKLAMSAFLRLLSVLFFVAGYRNRRSSGCHFDFKSEACALPHSSCSFFNLHRFCFVYSYCCQLSLFSWLSACSGSLGMDGAATW